MAGDLLAASYRDVGSISFEALPGASSALGVLLSLLAALGVLELGAPARLLRVLADPVPALGLQEWGTQVARSVLEQVLAAIELALTLAAPLLAVALLTQVVFAVTARAAAPVSLLPALPALRAVAVLLLFALLLQTLALALFEQMDLRLP
jgi:type III secretory pathway component EscT